MKRYLPVLIFILSFGLPLGALADGADDLGRLIGQTGESSSVTAQDSNILKLTPDRTHIVRLEEDAASVIVTNPAHATIMLDSPRLLVVMPRQPGATTFTVLNNEGKEILVQDVIVTATQPKYVRVRRMCDPSDSACAPNAYFYCPDGCYEVMTVPAETSPADVPEIAGSSGGTAAAQGPLMPTPGGPLTQQQEQEEPDDEELDADGEPVPARGE